MQYKLMHTYSQLSEVAIQAFYGTQMDMYSAACLLWALREGREPIRSISRKNHVIELMRILGPPPLSLLLKSRDSNFQQYFAKRPLDGRPIQDEQENAIIKDDLQHDIE